MKRVRKIKKKGKREFIVFAISQLILGKKSNPYLRLVETPRHTVSLNSVQIPEGTDIVRYTVHEPLHSSTCPPDVNYLPPIRRTNVPLSYAFIFHPLYFHMYICIYICIFWTAGEEGATGIHFSIPGNDESSRSSHCGIQRCERLKFISRIARPLP